MGNQGQVREGSVVEPQMHAPAPEYGPKEREKPLELDIERRLTHTGTVFLPEDIIGSVREYRVPVPMNLDRGGRPALITATAMDEHFALTSSEVNMPSVFGRRS